MLFKGKIKDDFDVEDVTTDDVKHAINLCVDMYKGHPSWVREKDHVKTVNFAKSICSETARLATLAIGIKIDGGTRAQWLQKQIDKIYFNLRNWVEYGCAYGTVILKPDGENIDIYTPDQFIVTDYYAGEIKGIVFINKRVDAEKKKYYTRLEYHRYIENGIYAITNRCYVGSSENDISKSIPITESPWADLLEEQFIENVTSPLYGVLRTPHANNIDIYSPLSLPVFADAVEELKDLDIAYSRNVKEILDSKRMVLLDSDRLMPSGTRIDQSIEGFKIKREELELPDFVRNVYGDGEENFYQEINPTLQTETRITGINSLLSQIGYKCGFSNGYFVFNESSGIQTATGVEAEQQRTIQFIKDVRDKLEDCLDDLIYALNIFADVYKYAPLGDYEVTYDFGDITYSYEADKQTWYSYAVQNRIPFWYYLAKFENMTEEEAKKLVEAAEPSAGSLFNDE